MAFRTIDREARRKRAAQFGLARSQGWCEALEPRVLLTFNPTADEQYMLELVNRFRMNPQAELGLMTSSLGTQARSADPDVDSALRFFQTNGVVLQQQWASLSAAPPLAWNAELTEAAEFHTLEMIAQSMQEHQLPGEPDLGDRATTAGYTGFSALGESIFAFARSIAHGHAGFLLDWGSGPNGIQDPPGHRNTAISGNFREIGIRIIAENSPFTSVGPLVMTLDFGNRFAFGNPFMLGVVYSDMDGDGAYSPGEGLGGVNVQVRNTGNDFGPVIASATSMDAGGYQLKVAPGVYNVTFSGGPFGSSVTYRNVSIAGSNLKLDARQGFVPPVPLLQVLGGAMGLQMLAEGDASPSHAEGTYFGDAELNRGFVDRTFVVVNAGTGPLTMQGLRVSISGTNASDFVVLSVPEGTIAPGGQSEFVVRFDPTNTKLRNATMTITSDDVTSPVFTLALRGRGMALPELQVKGKGRVIPDGFSAPTTSNLTNFTGVNIVSGFKDRTFRLFNLGSADLTISSVTIEGESASDFTVRVISSLTVAPGGAVNLRIRFNPSGPDFRHAQVRIVTNDHGRSPWTFAIRGFGVATPAIAILGGAAQAASIGVDAPPQPALGTDYGDVRIVNHTRLRTFTVVNDGFADLWFTGGMRVVISGPNAAEFKLARNIGVPVIGPGSQAEFAIRFNPGVQGGPGLRTAVVTITSNDPWAPAYSFELSGMAV